MEKSKHEYNNSQIPYEELNNFILPISMNLDISIFDLMELGRRYQNEIFDYISYIYHIVLETTPNLVNKLKTTVYGLCKVTYTPHTNGYDFRVNPITLFNKIFQELNLDYKIPFINLDNPTGMEYLKDYIRSYINDVKRITTKEDILVIMDELDNNLDRLCSCYDFNLDTKLKKLLIPKDVLFHLAYKSLIMYEITKDDRYLVYPHEYYKHVSDMTTSEYPHKITMLNKFGSVWFNDFRNEYEFLVGKDYEIDESKYLLNDSEVYLAWDILTPGMVDRELRDIVEVVRSNPNVDYQKYQRLFEMKMNYYMQSGYNKYIKGRYGLNGYVGFSYPNEYLVFDKFHNSETIDPSKKTILTHGEAIYALPSDRFSIVQGDKQTVLAARRYDDRIKKINHTETFINRVNPIVHGPNVSYSTIEDELEKAKQSVLIRKK